MTFNGLTRNNYVKASIVATNTSDSNTKSNIKATITADNIVKAQIYGHMIIYRANPYKTRQKPTYLPKSTPYGKKKNIYSDFL